MRSLMRRIDMFCYKHPKFGIKNLMMYIIAANAVLWLLGRMDTTGAVLSLLSFDARAIFTQGQVWRLVTFVFLPYTDSLLTLVIKLYFYYFMASTLEATWGKGRFTIYYLSGMLLNVLYASLMWFLLARYVSLDAMYLNLSLLFAFATLYPDTQVRLFFFIPLKVKWLAIAEFVFYVVLVVITRFPNNFLPIVAILNYLLFCGSWIPKLFTKAKFKQRKQTVDYKAAARKYNRQQSKQKYTRKCEVCGRTDTDQPDLEFRFCSKCEGYHCFCMDHISSHVHFKE